MLTAQQLCVLGSRIGKGPGFLSQAGQFLQTILNELVQHRDLKVNRVTTTITVQANSNGPFNLALDYLRTYDLFFQQNNLPYFLHPIGMYDYDAEFKDPSIANYPYEYATDLSMQIFPAQSSPGTSGQLFIYPQSSGIIVLTHRYMQWRAELASPLEQNTNVPWFIDQDYLIHSIARDVMALSGDERHKEFMELCENKLRKHLIMEGDEQPVVKQVRLDPRRFRTNRYLRPTKVTG